MSSTTANAGAGAKETLDAETLMKMSLFEMMHKGIDPCSPKVKCLVDDYYKSHFVKEEEEEVDEEDEEEEDEEEEEKDEGDEAGLMDYRGDVTAVEKDRRITIILNFGFNESDDDCLLPIPENFEEKWCASYNPKEIAQEAIGEEYTILDAFWSGTKLHILVDNLDESLNVDEIIDDLENNSLEDAQYEAAPGDGFWVISYGDLQKAMSE